MDDDGPILREVNPDEVLLPEDEKEEENVEDDVPFTVRMRQVTKNIHSVSDKLINAKLGIAMSDDRIWAEGLLVFYEIFKFLEDSIERLRYRVEYFERFRKVLDLKRKAAFERDLELYYGENWKSTCYVIRPSVAKYLNHLERLEQREPLRILAYIYHMYMGLLSGGQIIKKKRDLKLKLTSGATGLLGFLIPPCILNATTTKDKSTNPADIAGMAVTNFCIEGRSISSIKKDIVFTMNDIVEDLSLDEKKSLLDESIQVFERNNQIVATIQVSWFDAFRTILATNHFVAFGLLTFLATMWYLLFH